MWISGLETVRRKLGLGRVIDLSATPFFLRGSGYPCIPFGWTVPRKYGAQSTRRARVGWNIFRQFAHRRRGRSIGSSRFPASPGWMPCPCCTTGQPLRPISRTRRDFTDR